MSAVGLASAPGGASTVLGHPRGLLFLAFTEAWERFSYYGMSALLALYMVNHLLVPEHVAHVAGLAELRAAIESVVGPLSAKALASQIFGLYSGFVYFTPLLGGLIADRWIGQRLAVVIGALAMCAGHVTMTFDRSFLAALVLLVIGSGLLKGNISAQVGALYPRDDELRRGRGYVIFSTAINLGAITGPIVCGLLAQLYGWHYGFGVAAVFMLVALAIYLYGFRHLPARVERARHEAAQPTAARLTAAERRVVRALAAVIFITVFHAAAIYQLFNVLPVWIQEHVSRDLGGFRVPVPWYLSVQSIASVVAVPLLFWLWRWQSSRGRAPDELTKIGTGAWFVMAGNLVLVVASLVSGGARVHPIWPIFYSVGMGVGFLYYWPTLLALISRAAPARVNATMMGIAFMSLFLSNTTVGWIGGFYERTTPARFWGIHAAIAATGGLLMLLLGRRLATALRAD